MDSRPVDLRELLLLIDQQKNLDTNMLLDHGCLIDAADPRPLVKAINYMLNFLNEYSGERIEVALNLNAENIRLKLMSFWEHSEVPAIADQLAGVFADYGGVLSFEAEPGKYLQFMITFSRANT